VAGSLISSLVVAWAAPIIGAFLLVSPPAYAQTAAAVPGNHPALAESLIRSGGLEPARMLSMSVTLALRNQDQLRQLLDDLQNPASTEFHHFLTPYEFAARFGPTDFDAVRDWLASQGFKVVAINTATRVIQFSGTVAQAEQAFEVGIAAFGDISFGNATDPHIPARFAGVIGHIHGLDNLSASTPGLTVRRIKLVAPSSESSLESGRSTAQLTLPARDSESGRAPQSGTRSSVPAVVVGKGGPTVFGPSDFYTFYDETQLLSSGVTGSSCIAIVGDSEFQQSSIASFNMQFKVASSTITTVLADGTDPAFNDDESEANVDLEWSHAVAPGAASRFYLGNPATAQVDPIVDAIATAVTEDRCPVISISFDYCGQPDSFYTEVLDPLFAQAAAQGQSVITLSGYQGATYLSLDSATQQCVTGTSRAVNEMAADPNVTALGGTSFDPHFDAKGNDVGHVAESVWNDSGGASGGGVSAIFTKPAFQSGPGVPNDGMRDVPDLSLIAGPPVIPVVVDASCLFDPNGCTGMGVPILAVFFGTSLSAQAFAGIANLIEQAVGGRLGNLNPTIYALAYNDQAGSGFRDVTTGNNDFNGVTGFSAGPGYNQATGWGTVDITKFVKAYANTLPGTAARVTLSPAMLNFKNVASGTTSKPKFVTIKAPNGQKAWTLISSVAGSGPFTAAQTCVGRGIRAGKSCKFGVTFSPTMTGPVGTLMLTVTDNADNSPQTVSLTGSGK